MNNLVIFDIETVPDTYAWAKYHNINNLSETEIANAMFALRRGECGNEFLPHCYHQVVCISVVVRTSQQLKIYSLGTEVSDEAEIIELFFQGIERLTPSLVSWNGSGFDCPVLHYRALLHGINASCYWETGKNNQNFRWDNYLNRYHERHLDLMDVLASYTNKAYASLDKIACLLGFPGKMGMDGSKVWEYYKTGKIADIRAYCETDVLNTYLVYLRFQLMRGHLFETQYLEEVEFARQYLKETNRTYFEEFLNLWAT